ncbi:MAG: hypothetical protein CVV27_18585 [Candidatus Melainabacteria bacterium HGW-Melainabacteria-1]|nr:MAG: hypothetical protein CVV27_18585 [Candidatus Melainabacteria bacterium HGW-Melainabacteria-1]
MLYPDNRLTGRPLKAYNGLDVRYRDIRQFWVIGLLLMGAVGFGATAQEVKKGQAAQQVKCTWQGVWGIKGNPKVAPLSWTGYAFTAPNGGWLVYANGKDSSGPSRLRGGCMGGLCDLQQKYIAGPLQHKLYYYKLKYKLTPLHKGLRSISFTGTWGAEMNQGMHRGTAQVKGSCRLDKTPLTGLPKQLGWSDATY